MFSRWNFVQTLGVSGMVMFAMTGLADSRVNAATWLDRSDQPNTYFFTQDQKKDDKPGDKPDEKKEKLPTIKEIMKQAHKDGLLKKVATKKGKPADAKKLLELYEAMAKQKQPIGDAKSWKAKNDALVAAAKAMVDGKADAQKLLRSATNCVACHKLHKPKVVVEDKK